MSSINTNVSSLIAQNDLAQQNTALNTSLERLSTGLQINRGADNPAGLIASQSLQSESASITAAIGNAQSADQVVNTADGALSEVNSLLLQVQGLVGESANQAGQGSSELQANQLQVNSILQSIDRIAATTTFQGVNLLNGNYDFTVSGQSSKIAGSQINAATLPAGSERKVAVVITNSAQHGTVFLSTGGTALHLASAGARFQFDLAGALGTQSFSFASGTTLVAIASAINTFASVTGVSAAVSGDILKAKSTQFGSNQFVSFNLTNDGGQSGSVALASSTNENKLKTSSAQAFSSLTNAFRASGENVGATINGETATSSGLTTGISTDFLDVSLTLNSAGAQSLSSFNAFTITGGGANFNLGPSVNITNQASIGIGNVSSESLGNVSTGFLSSLGSGGANNLVNGNLDDAQNVVNAAIDQVSSLRGRLGAFDANVVQTQISSLNVALENTQAANSSIEDTNFASETANLSRSQILVQAATQALSIANSNPQNVLKLLQNL